MSGTFGFTIRDRSKELSSVNFHIGEVTAATLANLLETTGNLREKTEAITLGVVATDRMQVFNNTKSTATPSSPWANRETKFLIRYRDNQEAFGAIPNEGFGKIFTVEIPCPNLGLTGLLQDNSDFVRLDQTDIAAWIVEFELTARSPHGGTVKVDSIEIVGRRN